MMKMLERLARGEVLVCDGAMGSWLIAKGLGPGASPEQLNLTHPDWIEEISTLYRAAGADILQTNTFGGSPLRLAQHGLEQKFEPINSQAVQLAKKAAAGRVLIAASCGPSGRMLKPYGDTDPQEVYESFRTQMDVLVSAGVDSVFIETITDLQEAKIALRAARDTVRGLPVFVTLTFDETPKGFLTMSGDSIQAAAEQLKEGGADGVGSNCGNGIENMVQMAREFRRVTGLPLLMQSNAGLPSVVEGKLVHPETPVFFALHARELVAAGISIIGGCCGTTPDHIRAIRLAVDEAAVKNVMLPVDSKPDSDR